MKRVLADLTEEEKNLVHLELMIMEQVADWELDIGKVEGSSTGRKNGVSCHLGIHAFGLSRRGGSEPYVVKKQGLARIFSVCRKNAFGRILRGGGVRPLQGGVRPP
jgi:hypothetical protein